MQLAYNNKFKPQNNSFVVKLKRNATKLSAIVVFLVVVVVLIVNTSFSKARTAGATDVSTKLHSYYANDIPVKNALIFPSIEHAPLLREMGVDALFNTKVDAQGKKLYLMTEAATEDSEASLNRKFESDDSKSQLLHVKKSFLEHGKLKYTGSSSPDVVVVTLVDFEKYEQTQLIKIVQNRVNYAQKHNYGIYVRWTQEFLPMLSVHNAKYDWAKLYALRAAMYAFPNAKYFWYLNEEAMIMRYDIDMVKYLLNPKVLDPIMLRNQPIVPPNGVIRTFKNTDSADVDLVVTQAGQDINTDSFILKNTFLSKALVEFWNDETFKSYHNFPRLAESALTHILQWHPKFLAHTAIVPPRTIAGLDSDIAVNDDIHYSKGDFVVVFRDCEAKQSCSKEIDQYWSIAESK